MLLNMKNAKKHILSGILAACMICGLTACGGGPEPDIPGGPAGATIPDARTEQQDAIDRENQVEQDHIQEELDFMENNTKPYMPGVDADNKTGTGMAGLDDEDEDTSGSDDGEDQDDGSGDGVYATDGNYVIPEGMPELTMESLGVPEWSGQPWAVLNSNAPYFTEPESRPRLAETYSSLDSRRRPGSALICLKERADNQPDYSFEIKAGSLSVPGWNEDAYPGVVRNIDKSKFASGEPADGKVFYMRRLLGNGIGTMTLGRRNTMVCTEYMGEYGLQALEDAVLRYVERSKRRVIYRVTPIFEGSEQIARGAVVEAMSYGDSADDVMNNKDLCFNLFVYNVQPGVTINYSTGVTTFDDQADTRLSTTICDDYILDTSRKEAHMPTCEMLIRDVNPAVQSFWYGTTDDLAKWSIDWNYCPCMDGVLSGYEPSEDASGEPDDDEDPDEPARSGSDNMLAGDLAGVEGSEEANNDEG